MALIKFSLDEINARLIELSGWELEEGKLRWEFTFTDFIEIFGFMARVALLAETAGYHPEWFNAYNRVRIALTTHDVNGISNADFDLANKINRLANRWSPTSLQSSEPALTFIKITSWKELEPHSAKPGLILVRPKATW